MLVVRALAVAAFLFFGAKIAAADDAETLIEQGIELREKGKDEEALAKFERAFSISPTPRGKAQIALCEQALGRWISAERDLNDALAPGDAWIAKNKGALDGALATIRTHLGDLVLIGGADGASVRVDGRDIGTLPLRAAIRLEIGTHTLEVTHALYYPVSEPVSIRADAPARVSLEMHARATEPPKPIDKTPEKQPPTTAGGGVQRAVGIGIAASAAVPLALGFIGIAARQGQVSAYNDDPSCPSITSQMKSAACQSRIDAADTWQAASIVGFILAGSFLVAGAIVALTAPSAKNVAFDARGVAIVF